MTLYQSMQQNLNEGMIGVHPSIQSLAQKLRITKQFNYDDFLATLGCFCDFTVSKDRKAIRVEIHEIDDQPMPDFHSTVRGDYSKLKCEVEDRERACVYIIYSKEHDMIYVGSTLCLKSRYSYWKCVSAKGSQEAGARVFRFEDSLMMPLLIANGEDCTEEKLRLFEKCMINFAKFTKGEYCVNDTVLETEEANDFGAIGEVNWDVLKLLTDKHVSVIDSNAEVNAA